MLNFILSNSIWKNDDLFVTFRQPFDLIAKTTTSGPYVYGGAGGQKSASLSELVGEVGLEPTKAKPADLQSAPFAARDTPPDRARVLKAPERAEQVPLCRFPYHF